VEVEMPVDSLTAETVTGLVADAVRAPSMHNAQPWRFVYHTAEETLRLYADMNRSMPRTDPDLRALHLGCGSALFNLRVAAAHAGREPRTELLPDRLDPFLLATVRLPVTDRPDPGLVTLYPAIRRRHTSRRPFSEREVPPVVVSDLCDAARDEGAMLTFPGSWHTEHLLNLVHDAEGRDILDPDTFGDVTRWTHPEEGGNTGDGIPASAFGPRKRDGKAPVRDFAGRRPVPGRPTAVFERRPHLALLGTRRDEPADWLRGGQALERVLLLATLDGLATSLTSHPLEWKDLRLLARDPLSTVGVVHMVLRLGYGPGGPATPRRPVEEVLQIR
jgi:nitroreductase